MKIPIFNYGDYQLYLKDVLNQKDAPYGFKSEFARTLGCQSSFVSQVIAGRVHLTQDHAIKASLFLGLENDERDYFMTLVRRGKAGSTELKSYLDKQLNEIKNNRKEISNILKVKNNLTPEKASVYYSGWWYSAIHILSALGIVKNEYSIAKQLGISVKMAKEAITFLLETSMIIKTKDGYKIGSGRIHLDAQSPLISRHHANWRIKVTHDIEKMTVDELHYSGIIGVSKKDGEKIHNFILEMIAKTEQTITKSKEEAAYIMLADFYELKI